MADENDLSYVLSGNIDLVGCVLDGADLSGMDLSGRDFRRARLKKVNFSGSDLSEVNFEGAQFQDTDFSNANLSGCRFHGSIFRVNFSQSNLSNSVFSGVLHTCNLAGSNLSGANFSSAHLNEQCNFSEVLFDRSTNFSGTVALRPYLHFEVFRNYELKRGVFILRPTNPELELPENKANAIQALRNGFWELSRHVETSIDAPSLHASFGHNNPPEEFKISEADLQEVKSVFSEAEATLRDANPNQEKLFAAAQLARHIASTATRWAAQKLDIAANEFSKSIGNSLGSKTAIVAGSIAISGAMEKILEFLMKFMP